jgi:Uma2 family endonuclease
MVAARESFHLTPQEYFDWEEQQELRYEYFEGQVYAMTGGSLAHGRIGLNIGSMLRESLRSQGCIVFNSDCKVGISAQGPFTYPDISVSCDDRDRTAQKFVQFPCLIIEVLSPGTEAYDRGKKFALYRRLASLQEYLLVGSETPLVELFRRNALGNWEFTTYEEGEITLDSLGITLSMNSIYEDVSLISSEASNPHELL